MNEDGGNMSDQAARAARLRERASAARPESWVPKEAGDELLLDLLRYETGETPYGPQIIAVGRTLDGVERGVWLLHSVLRDRFAELRPVPGELLLIRYLGKKQSAAGQSYAAYRVEVDREPVAPDWSAIGGEPEQVAGNGDRSAQRHPAEPSHYEEAPHRGDDDIPF